MYPLSIINNAHVDRNEDEPELSLPGLGGSEDVVGIASGERCIMTGERSVVVGVAV